MCKLDESVHHYKDVGWTNGWEDCGLIMECLDRGLANGDWRSLLPRAIVVGIVDNTILSTPHALPTSLGIRTQSSLNIAQVYGQ